MEITVKANRWQDSYGNTYHIVRVYTPTETLTSERTYGYGTHYLHTAGTLLGYDGYDFSSWRWREENGIVLTHDVKDVPRRRDLDKF